MNINRDDVLAVALTKVSRNGMKREFEVYKYDKQEERFHNITDEVAKGTGLKQSSSGAVINPVVGMDMMDGLVNYIYKKNNLGNDYQDGSRYIKINLANKDPYDKEKYDIITRGKLGEQDIRENFPQYRKEQSLNDYHKQRYTPNTAKEYGLACIEKDEKSFQYLPKEIRDIEEVGMKAFEKNANNFAFLSENLRDNKELALEAVKKEGMNLEFVSDRLKNDEEVVMTAIKDTYWSMEHAGDKIKGNKEFINKAIDENGGILAYADDKIKADKETVLRAVKSNERAIVHASDEIKEMCMNKDPVQTLERAIMYDKMKSQLKPKQETKPTQSLKI